MAYLAFSESDVLAVRTERLARVDMQHADPELIRTVDGWIRIAKKNTDVRWTLVVYDLLVLPIALVLLFVLGHPLLIADPNDNRRWKTTEMPSDWLASVSSLPSIDHKARDFLQKVLDEKGWVSIEEAWRFIALQVDAMGEAQKRRANEEAKERRAQATALEAARERHSNEEKAAKSSEGAALVRERLKRRDMTDP